jgi:hypothetical protein
LKLRISDDLSLPVEAVTQTFADLAKRGAGKTYLASVLAEEMLAAGHSIVALDPTGGWWGLRSGFPIAVLGGEHADVPLQETAGEVIAQAIVENRFSAVIDLSLFRKGQMIRFMVSFLETLYRLNREPLHLFVDEADAFAPQGRTYGGGEENRMLGAMEDLVRRGRKRGIGCTLITQRPAVLNKNVLTQCESVFALRMVHPRDIGALKEWINVHADPDEAKEVIDSLPSLPVGEAWFWSPGWMGTLKRIKVRKRETFDSSATPKPGESVKAPKSLAKIDMAALGQQIQATVQKAKENDPAELRRQLAEARGLIAKLKDWDQQRSAVTIERVEVPVLKNGQLDKAHKLVDRLAALAEQTTAAASQLASAINVKLASAPALPKAQAAIPKPAPVIPKRPDFIPDRPVSSTGEAPQGGLRRMLIALAQRPQGLSAQQLGVRAGMSSSSGTFGTYLGKGRANGWIEGDRSRLTITGAGQAALGHYEPLPTGPELLAYWLGELGGGAARMLQVLADAYPNALTAEDLGERAGMSAGSGTFGTYLGKLRTLELVTGSRAALRASEELFE